MKQKPDFDLLDHVSSGWIASKSVIAFLFSRGYPMWVGMSGDVEFALVNF